MSFLRHGPDRDCARAMSILEATAHSSTNQTLKPAFDAFRSLTPALRKALLESIDIIDNTPNIIDIRNDLLSMLRVAVRPQHRASALERLEGWWFNRVAHMLKPGGGSPLAGFELFEKLRSIAEQFTPDSLPIDYATAHPPTQPDPESDQRRFVLQLKCLSVSPKRIENAILDYYRASQQRGRWAREELLVGDEVAQFEAKLVDEWERMRLILIDDSGRTAAEEELRKVGLDLLKWMETVADVRIRPNVTADYVRRGSYHMLAEDDPARVWWHPLFAERIQALLSASVST